MCSQVGDIEPSEVYLVARTVAHIARRSIIHVETPSSPDTLSALQAMLAESVRRF